MARQPIKAKRAKSTRGARARSNRRTKMQRAAKQRAVNPNEFFTKHDFDTSDALTDLQFNFTRKMTFVVNKWINRLNDEFRVIDQSQARWRALFWIAASKGRANQRELADLMGIEGPTLARLLDRLEADGLVERCAVPDDRRAKVIRLTKASRPLVLKLARMSERIRSEILSDIRPSELRVCDSVFDRVIAKLAGPS